MSERMIVIGANAAGLSAASKARRLRPDLEITVFEQSGFASYGACGLPYFVGGKVKEAEDLISLPVEQAEKQRNIHVLLQREVIGIDRAGRQVHVKELKTGQVSVWPYDSLIIATGAAPVTPSVAGGEGDGVYRLRTLEDGIALREAVSNGEIVQAAVIGGGFIGLELAEELTEAGIKVHVLELGSRLLPFLPEKMSEQVRLQLERHDVQLWLNTQVKAIRRNAAGKIVAAEDQQGRTVRADAVIFCVGVRPCADLAAAAGLALGAKGAIAVDDEMRTSDPHIWAAGDCVEVKNRADGEKTYIPLGTTANKQGRVAGANAAGQKTTFPGVVGSMITKVFDLYVGATGLSRQQADREGYDVEETMIFKGDRASYYPGGTDICMNLIFERKGGRLLGAQAAGSESVAGRLNVLAAAITCGMTVMQLSQLDLVYAPSVAPVYDPILIAAEQASKKVRR